MPAPTYWIRAAVAQDVAWLSGNQEVAGSIPGSPLICVPEQFVVALHG